MEMIQLFFQICILQAGDFKEDVLLVSLLDQKGFAYAPSS